MSKIIGITGRKGVGKDTLAEMICYIYNSGVSGTTYEDFITYEQKNIIHFADYLKQCVSTLYGIPLEFLNSQEYKKNYYYCFNDGHIWSAKDVGKHTNKDVIHTVEKLGNLSICEYRKQHSRTTIFINFRTLLQYFGTELCRNNLGDDIFTKSTIELAKKLKTEYPFVLIADVRFLNEAKSILEENDDNFIIKVKRNLPDNDTHISEHNNIPYQILIDNNGTLKDLFKHAKHLVYEHLFIKP